MATPELIVHAHFYQPPRENPWTEEVGRERSAAPFHDWNSRITAECYRPNGMARIVDDANRVLSIVDNYSLLSFNAGPTLLSWLEREEPTTYQRIVAADKIGGGAIAQGFSHSILPLATERDIRTQVRWGLADFAYRFGRQAKGMWLPECAVNDVVLKILAEEGVTFTILAPSQAARIRPLDGSLDWVDMQGSWLDASRPYRWLHPANDGRGVDLVFYHGPLSQALAFEMASLSSQALVDRMIAASSGRGGLVTLATDGETFGHHHRYGERLLAYALNTEIPRRQVVCTNVNRALEHIRPTHEVQVHESAWSCVHGVGRWKQDCGCSTGGGPGWNQKWRTPLLASLNQLREVIAEVFHRRAPAVFRNAEAALYAYVEVIIGATTTDAFAAAHITGDPVEAFTLLEAERHAMAMFTSCGWFFNDLAGLETVQVLRYAGRAVDLIVELGEPSPLDTLLSTLALARSNIAEEGTGADIWQRHVVPERVDAARVVQHIALSEVLENKQRRWLGPYEAFVTHHSRQQRGSVVLAVGVATLHHRRTGRETTLAYAVVGLGGLEVNGVLRSVDGDDDIAAVELLSNDFAQGLAVSTLLARLAYFGDKSFDLAAALPDEAARLLEGTADGLADRYAATYTQLYEDHRATLEDLTRNGYELPPILRAPAELSLARRFSDEVMGAAASTDPAAYEAAIAVARQAQAAGFSVNTSATNLVMQRLILETVQRAVTQPNAETVQVALDVLALAIELRAEVDMEPAQELVYFALQRLASTANAADTANSAEQHRQLAPLGKVLQLSPPVL